MGKQFKVLKISSNWSLEKLRQKLEDTLNTHSKQGWDVVNISFLDNTYTAFVTISK
ncbi:hypothetical protein [Aquimarina mytili]|uniref:DUF4177 domain-containing protein n=1 Tax=Aquimarina mytili TaxID=874423 RepID=A0A936ZU24_9FLAO|nr:hypothetical protein [Aquimarina mytili]MBL0684708.1 hypothetical protein [Aquimarina mytili]